MDVYRSNPMLPMVLLRLLFFLVALPPTANRIHSAELWERKEPLSSALPWLCVLKH